MSPGFAFVSFCLFNLQSFDCHLHFLQTFGSSHFHSHSRLIPYAMAPKGHRHHPYRATTEIDAPGDPLSRSWCAGPGRQPGGDDHPPSRPILIIIASTTRHFKRYHIQVKSTRLHFAHCTTTTSGMPPRGNKNLCLPGHNSSLPRWPQPFKLPIFGHRYAIACGPNGRFA